MGYFPYFSDHPDWAVGKKDTYATLNSVAISESGIPSYEFIDEFSGDLWLWRCMILNSATGSVDISDFPILPY